MTKGVIKLVTEAKPRFLCRIGWHDWTKWEPTIVITKLIYEDKEFRNTGQRRFCKACGRKQLRSD